LIFIDNLSVTTCIIVVKLFRKASNFDRQQTVSVFVLDPINKSLISSLLIKSMGLFGFSISEAEFFSGDLRTEDGHSIYTKAKILLTDISFKAAENTTNASKFLFYLNNLWGRNTILHYLARCYFLSAWLNENHTIFKILVANALSRDTREDNPQLVLGLPAGFTPDLFENIDIIPQLYTYKIKNFSIRSTRMSALFLIIYYKLTNYLKSSANIFPYKQTFGDVTIPTLLLLQEDDLSLDKSYRGQPHWLFPKETAPNFRTLILLNKGYSLSPEPNELENFKVYGVPNSYLYHAKGKHDLHKTINSSLRKLIIYSAFDFRISANISFQLANLLMKASLLANFCISHNVKTFMACENYLNEVFAMNLIRDKMSIHSISYQYSNMSELTPHMLTNADTMITFSPLFHDRYTNKYIKPKSFVDVGYLYNSSFSLIEERASILRKALIDKGSKFIITYFDESIQTKKYGMIHINNHYEDIIALAKLVNNDSTITVVIKSQFINNSPGVIFKGNNIVESAIDTGRFIDIFHGNNRNIILPSEAAMASDFVIGHAVGATAGLEAALCGKRCILLNPYDMYGSNIDIFKSKHILYPKLETALKAIVSFKNNNTKLKDLGDWSDILKIYDPFLDRKSANRTRSIIEDSMEV
jgi:hypothetical protein